MTDRSVMGLAGCFELDNARFTETLDLSGFDGLVTERSILIRSR